MSKETYGFSGTEGAQTAIVNALRYLTARGDDPILTLATASEKAFGNSLAYGSTIAKLRKWANVNAPSAQQSGGSKAGAAKPGVKKDMFNTFPISHDALGDTLGDDEVDDLL